MHSLLQPGRHSSQKPLWLRWVTVFCIVLIAVMTTVQVCHTHTPALQEQGTHQGTPAPDHCPLCMAMHSAMPVTPQAAPEPVLHMQALDSTAADAERLFRWRFQLASRPPPVNTLSA
jgi:hypothetical protein